MKKEMPELAVNMVAKIKIGSDVVYVYITDVGEMGSFSGFRLQRHENSHAVVCLSDDYHYRPPYDNPVEIVSLYGISNLRYASGYGPLSPCLLDTILSGSVDSDCLGLGFGNLLIWTEPVGVEATLENLRTGLGQLISRMGYIQKSTGFGEQATGVADEVETYLNRLLERCK